MATSSAKRETASTNGVANGLPKTIAEVMRYVKAHNIQIVDMKFNDLPGLWQHTAVPVTDLEDYFANGKGFDGSSIRGFKAIQESDMILMPDPATAVLDPFCAEPTLSVTCDIYDPMSKQPYSRDPRFIAKKAEEYLRQTKLADTSYWGPEAEFFVFDDIRFGQNQHSGFYYLDSVEGSWNTGRQEGPNLGYKPRYKEGYFPCAPHDTMQDLRSEMMLLMNKVGIDVECHHHEVATGGQNEIDVRYTTLVEQADKMQWYKYIVRNVAKKYGKTATFMPKPLFQDNGSGMHTHMSLWKAGKPLFFDQKGYAGISDMCRYYIGGILKHAPAILAFAAPTTNSYKRLVPGYEAPVNLVYSARNRSAAIRIPMYSNSPKAKRIEFRSPDPACNTYVSFAAMLMAGLDGIQNKIDPGAPLEKNIYEMSEKELKNIRHVPKSLDEALTALEKDHEFLLKGDVFTKDVIDTWIAYKRAENDQLRLRPHPWEFHLYYDV